MCEFQLSACKIGGHLPEHHSASSALGESHQLDSVLHLTHVGTCHDSESLSAETGTKEGGRC